MRFLLIQAPWSRRSSTLTRRASSANMDYADRFEKLKVLLHIGQAHWLVLRADHVADFRDVALSVYEAECLIQHVVAHLRKRHFLLEVLVSCLLDQPPPAIFGSEEIHRSTNFRVARGK